MTMLRHLAEVLEDDLGLSYQFSEYLPEGGELPPVFWEGQLYDEPVMVESGMSTAEVTLIGTCFGQYGLINEEKQKLKNTFILGHRARLDDGSTLYIRYNGSSDIPSQDNDIKRVEVSLFVTEWRVY